MKTSRWILTLTLFWTDRLVVSGHWSVGETKGNFASRVFFLLVHTISDFKATETRKIRSPKYCAKIPRIFQILQRHHKCWLIQLQSLQCSCLLRFEIKALQFLHYQFGLTNESGTFKTVIGVVLGYVKLKFDRIHSN